jgi:hypothetical protein
MLKKLWPPRVPWRFKTAYEVTVGIESRYGRYRTAATGRCVDRDGNPIPWITYPAIEYLSQLDFRQQLIFEFGSGYSTLYWARRARRVVAVEHDSSWIGKLGPLPPNAECLLQPDPAAYPDTLLSLDEPADVIVIDGIERQRCAERAMSRLNKGGLVILDNADWHLDTARYLREQGLIEVDMHGFVPINGNTSTTALFFARDFDRQPLDGHQPKPSICAYIPAVDSAPRR